MAFSEIPDVVGNGRRRLCAFLAVALAVFVLGVSVMGMVCHGYALTPEARLAAASKISPDEAATALTQANDELKSASHHASQLLGEYEASVAELVQFLDSHFKEITSVDHWQAAPDSAPQTSESIPQATASARRMIVNPEWRELHDALDKLERRHAELAAIMLPTHPALQTIEATIADLQAKIKSAPPEIPAAADSTIPAASAPQMPIVSVPTSPANQPIVSAAATKEIESRYHKLCDRVAKLKQEYASAIQVENAARERQQKADEDRLAAIAVPPGFRGTANPRLAFYLSGGLAILIGVLVAVRARVAEQTFRTAAEVRQALGLTVLGFLSRRSNESSPERPQGEPRWVSRSVAAAELVLAAAIAWIAVAAIFDKQFFLDFLANPLAACSQKFWC